MDLKNAIFCTLSTLFPIRKYTFLVFFAPKLLYFLFSYRLVSQVLLNTVREGTILYNINWKEGNIILTGRKKVVVDMILSAFNSSIQAIIEY